MGNINHAPRILSRLKNLVVRPGVRAVRVPFGLYEGLVLELDLQSQMQVYLGLWEAEIGKVLLAELKTARFLIDVGAGGGELAALFARQAQVSIVHAVEPVLSEVARLRRNLGLNGLDEGKVRVVTKLIGEKLADDTIRLDALEVPPSGIGVVKIDVDGAEMEVLRSGEALFRRPAMRTIVETHSRQLETECEQFFRERGYRTTVIPNAWWRALIPEQRPIEHNRWLWVQKG
jgi:predicted RNA methylase